MPQYEGPGLDALQRASDALNDLRAALECISDAFRTILRHSADFKIKFDLSGNVTAVSFRVQRLRGDGRTATELLGIEVPDAAERMRGYVEELRKSWGKSEAALDSLPPIVLQELDGVVGIPWRSSVRLNCLDVILPWPGETAPQRSYASAKISEDINLMLELAEKHDPFSTWATYLQLIDGYRRQLVAVRGAVTLPESSPTTAETAIASLIMPTGDGNTVRVDDLAATEERLRRCHERDHLWLGWHNEIGAGSPNVMGQIRDRWNALPASMRASYAPCHGIIGGGKSGYDVVRRAIAAAKKDGGNS